MDDQSEEQSLASNPEKGQADAEAWLESMMACYDAVEWQVAKERPELVAWTCDEANAEAIMRYYNQ